MFAGTPGTVNCLKFPTSMGASTIASYDVFSPLHAGLPDAALQANVAALATRQLSGTSASVSVAASRVRPGTYIRIIAVLMKACSEFSCAAKGPASSQYVA